MIVKNDLRFYFYEVIKKKNILILVGDDVDALCASLILTGLLRCDDAAFSVVPVATWIDVKKAIAEQEQSQVIVMLNCGGNRTLSELEIPEALPVFICDNRRPFDLDNVYDAEQVRIIVDPKEIEELGVPPIEDVFKEETSSDEDEDEDAESYAITMQRRALKREEKRAWEHRKAQALWRYYSNTWVSLPTSIRILELAFSLNRATPEFMWLASVGLNSLYVDNLINLQVYSEVCVGRIRQFIHKFAPKATPRSDDLFRISFDKELTLAVYTSWSLYSAMRVNQFFACKTTNWSQTGEDNMKKLYARLGITLAEARQVFSSLSTERKKEIAMILNFETKEHFHTFTAHIGYSARVTAADTARIVALKLEAQRPGSHLVDRFSAATGILKDMMSPGKEIVLQKNIEAYKLALELVYQYVATALNQSEIISMGQYYLYACSKVVDEGLMESRHFLLLFQNFVLEAFASSRKKRRAKPLIVAFPLAGNKEGWHIISGVMPLGTAYHDNYLKSVIGGAFEKCESSNLRMLRERFSPDIILLKSEDRGRFFEVLQTVFE
ncbi:unnamed protein product, partial [Mesorhabditis belari]|uniref:Uncharacterized protein n=1 Tax=Mesorhabditis belari TaxID=2138241 RepID=A0AAF3J4T9_9BILA